MCADYHTDRKDEYDARGVVAVELPGDAAAAFLEGAYRLLTDHTGARMCRIGTVRESTLPQQGSNGGGHRPARSVLCSGKSSYEIHWGKLEKVVTGGKGPDATDPAACATHAARMRVLVYEVRKRGLTVKLNAELNGDLIEVPPRDRCAATHVAHPGAWQLWRTICNAEPPRWAHEPDAQKRAGMRKEERRFEAFYAALSQTV